MMEALCCCGLYIANEKRDDDGRTLISISCQFVRGFACFACSFQDSQAGQLDDGLLVVAGMRSTVGW